MFEDALDHGAAGTAVALQQEHVVPGQLRTSEGEVGHHIPPFANETSASYLKDSAAY